MEITSAQIEAFAPNPAAAKNGRDLAAKGKFSNLHVDPAGHVIWGDCAGSGKNPYTCSADFAQPSAPTFRCSCPSRQFPCKHCLGLLYAHEKGQAFAQADLPEELVAKREKSAKRAEKKAEAKAAPENTKPKKVNTAALAKKLDMQLNGVATAEKILANILGAGFSSLDGSELRGLQAQVKELGNFYIPGIQAAFMDLLLAIGGVENENYTQAVDQATYIAALLKRAAQYLGERKEDPQKPPTVDSAIEEQIGTVWKLAELAALDRCEKNVSLMQLAFDAYDNPAKREMVEQGVWIDLGSGRLFATKNYRPFKAMKYVKAENSFSGVAEIGEMYVYPGDLVPRVRWEAGDFRERPVAPADLEAVHARAAGDYAAQFKAVRASIKNPLADKNPFLLLALHKSWRNGDDLVVEDASGTCLTLRDAPGRDVAAAIMLGLILPEDCAGLSLLVRVENDVKEGLFTAQPMSLVCRDKIVKLFW